MKANELTPRQKATLSMLAWKAIKLMSEETKTIILLKTLTCEMLEEFSEEDIEDLEKGLPEDILSFTEKKIAEDEFDSQLLN